MTANFRKFMIGALQICAQDISKLGILRVIRSDLPPHTQAYNEVLVIFKDLRQRDYVYMKSRLLAKYIDPETRKPTAGFRMEIPDYLMSTFKLLEEVGYQLRDEYGERLRKYIKYDDNNISLYMEVRFPEERRWFRMSPRAAKEIHESGDRETLDAIKTRIRHRSAERATTTPTPLAMPRDVQRERRLSAMSIDDEMNEDVAAAPPKTIMNVLNATARTTKTTKNAHSTAAPAKRITKRADSPMPTTVGTAQRQSRAAAHAGAPTPTTSIRPVPTWMPDPRP